MRALCKGRAKAQPRRAGGLQEAGKSRPPARLKGRWGDKPGTQAGPSGPCGGSGAGSAGPGVPGTTGAALTSGVRGGATSAVC